MAIVWPYFVGIGVGVLLVVVAVIVGWAVVPPVVEDQIYSETQLIYGTDQFERWRNLSQPLHFKVSFFEIQNPEAVHAGEEYPVVKEKGPYVYRQYKWKTDIEFSDDELTVGYYGNRLYVFDEEASGELRDTDEIHVLNPVINSIFQLMEMDPVQKHLVIMINSIVTRLFPGTTNLFLKTTPRAILFEGIEFCVNPTGAGVNFCETVQAASENIEPTEFGLSFALFRHKQSKPDGHYVVNTGIPDAALTHLIVKFNHDDKLNVWLNDDDGETSSCNKLYGSDGNLFPPFPKDDAPLPSLQSDVCRVVSVYYDGEAEYKGITGMVFRSGKDMLDEIGPEFGNDCLCINMTQGIDHTQDNGCLYKGALDLFNCLHGPIVMTKPHMLDADEIYTSKITGLEPDEGKHSTMMVIEPYTGIPLQGYKRIQLNQFLRPIYKFNLSLKYLPVLMPLLWIDEGIELNDEMIELLNDKLYYTLEAIYIAVWVVMGVGIAVAVGFTIVYFVVRCIF